MRQGFSLLELSIVLVIIGLLSGGILGGQALIHAAELRSVTSDTDKYRTAVYTFRDKYFGLPGDITNATLIWKAADPVPATCRGISSTAPATCDGNGDGRISTMDSQVTYSEEFHFWKQLANAGMIEGQYTGAEFSAGRADTVYGTNTPRARISNTGFAMTYLGTQSGSTQLYDGSYGNAFVYAAQGRIGIFSHISDASALTPEDAWNIDTKLDDGKPATGIIMTYIASNRPNCSSTDVISQALYVLTYTSKSCLLVIKTGF